jgi:hypothetical protein
MLEFLLRAKVITVSSIYCIRSNAKLDLTGVASNKMLKKFMSKLIMDVELLWNLETFRIVEATHKMNV